MADYLRREVRLPGEPIPICQTNGFNYALHWLLSLFLLFFFSNTREHHEITVRSMVINTRATAETSPRSNEVRPWCVRAVRRMWVPPAQEHQGEEFAVALLPGCQHTNLCDEVNFVDRHVAALKIGVPSPPVAHDLELDVNVGNVVSFVSATVFRFREHASGSRHICSFSVRRS